MDQHRPRMLKDFLNENISNSCSIPMKPNDPPPTTSMRTLIETDLNSNSNSRDSNPGIWSKTRLPKSALQAVLNGVKAVFLFTAVKKSPPAVIDGGSENKCTVKMKDATLWKLCRDPVVAVEAEEPPPPPDAAAAASCGSSGWSCWSENDLCSWECESEAEDAGNDVVADLEFSLFFLSPLSSEDYVDAATETAKAGNKVRKYI